MDLGTGIAWNCDEGGGGVAEGGEDTCQVEHPMAKLLVYIEKIVHFVFCHNCCAF